MDRREDSRQSAGARPRCGIKVQRHGYCEAALDCASGAFVIPPFGEAHNHNLEASSRIASVAARYLRDGVFHVENPGILPRNRPGLAGHVNTPSGPDAIFSNGLLTGAGGHPVEIVSRNVQHFAHADSIVLRMKDGQVVN